MVKVRLEGEADEWAAEFRKVEIKFEELADTTDGELHAEDQELRNHKLGVLDRHIVREGAAAIDGLHPPLYCFSHLRFLSQEYFETKDVRGRALALLQDLSALAERAREARAASGEPALSPERSSEYSSRVTACERRWSELSERIESLRAELEKLHLLEEVPCCWRQFNRKKTVLFCLQRMGGLMEEYKRGKAEVERRLVAAEELAADLRAKRERNPVKNYEDALQELKENLVH